MKIKTKLKLKINQNENHTACVAMRLSLYGALYVAVSQMKVKKLMIQSNRPRRL